MRRRPIGWGPDPVPITRWTPTHTWLCSEARGWLQVLGSQRRVGKTYARGRLLTLAVMTAGLAAVCPVCFHPRERHYGRWCRVLTGAQRNGVDLICCCQAVDQPAYQPSGRFVVLGPSLQQTPRPACLCHIIDRDYRWDCPVHGGPEDLRGQTGLTNESPDTV